VGKKGEIARPELADDERRGFCPCLGVEWGYVSSVVPQRERPAETLRQNRLLLFGRPTFMMKTLRRAIPRQELAEVAAVKRLIKDSEITLEDGTVLKVRPIDVSIFRIEGELDNDDHPKYLANFAVAVVKDCEGYSPPGEAESP